MSELIVENLNKSFGKHKILHSIHLKINHGLFGLLGPNGAGKTTLMRTLATIFIADSGEIQYKGTNWRKQPDVVRQMLGYLPQHFGVFRNISAMECMDYIASLKGIHDKKKRRIEIEALLDKVNLVEERNKKVGTFSGGMKRRLGIAQALIASPKIVLVDEPTAGLDPAERIRFRNLLRSLSEERIVILSTHIIEDIAATCRSLAVIKNGHATSFPSLQALASEAKGKVWKWQVRSEQYNQLHMKGEVISTEVTADAVELRVLSTERPDEAAVEVNPTIEEGYLVWNQKAERIL